MHTKLTMLTNSLQNTNLVTVKFIPLTYNAMRIQGLLKSN